MSPTSDDQKKKRPASSNNEDDQRVKQKTAQETSDASAVAAVQHSNENEDDVISILSTELSPTRSANKNNNINTFRSDYPRYDGKHLEEEFNYFQPTCAVNQSTAVIAGRPSARKNVNISVYATNNDFNWEVKQVLQLRDVAKAESIAISGENLMVVGITTAESKQREVYIYKKVKELWKKVEVVDAPEGFTDFASSISLDGNVMVVNPRDTSWHAMKAANRKGIKKFCPIYIFRITDDKKKKNKIIVQQEVCKTRFGKWGHTLIGMKGDFIATRECSAIHVYRYEGPAWRCIHRIFPDDVYVDEDPDTQSRETKCDARIQEVALTDECGSLLVGFGIGLPNETFTCSYGALHYYTLNDEGQYNLKQAVKLNGKHIWDGAVVGIAVDDDTMILSTKKPWERSVSVKYTLVGGLWKEERVINRERAIGTNLHLSGNKFIAKFSDNALFYTLDEEAFV